MKVKPWEGNTKNDYFDVIVSDLWFLASDIDKERYAMTFDEAFWHILYNTEFIDEKTRIYLYFKDEYGIELAEPDVFNGGYKILK